MPDFSLFGDEHVRQYEATGDGRLRDMAAFFWDQVVGARSFVTGGTSDNEAWESDPFKLSEELGANAHESCCTYNMLKLTRHLFGWEPAARYADYYERALWNGILPTQNPDDRVIGVQSRAAAFTPEDVEGLVARAVVLGASFRGEIPPETVGRLAALVRLVALDVQGYVRVVRDGTLRVEPWPESGQVLPLVRILKADIVEAEMLTGSSDPDRAARGLQELGPAEIVLTHRDGVLVRAGERSYAHPFVSRQILGRSGRGDTCLAAYTCRRLETEPGEAAVWAAAVTTLKMEAPGPFALGRAAVEQLIRERY